MQNIISILVVEDNADDFLLFKELLQSSAEIQSTIMHADHLEKAISIALEQAIDVVILNLFLPDSTGLDTFKSFHQQFPFIPTIIMTGPRDHEMALEAVKNGAQDYLFKGKTSSTDAIRTIRYAIERQSLRTGLANAKTAFQQSLDESKTRENEVKGLLKGAKAVLEQKDFSTTARKVFDICSELIGSTSGYVALMSDDGQENEVLFLEAGDKPCTVDPELPMPIRGLRSIAYQTNSTVYENDFMQSKWIEYLPEGHVALKNVMFAPLILEGKTVGVIGLANKETNFDPNDVRMASGFGELAAIALQNSRNLDKRDMAEKQSKKLIKELQKALAEVKKLSGMLPICSICKKIRDDKGYWNQIEEYIHEHADVEFSHSICRECADKYYPDYKLYDDN